MRPGDEWLLRFAAYFTAAICLSILLFLAGCATEDEITKAECEAMDNCQWIKIIKAEYSGCEGPNGGTIAYSAKPCNYREIGGYPVITRGLVKGAPRKERGPGLEWLEAEE